MREVWPNLELFMHGGVNFEPYRNQFKRIIPFDDMNYVETYNASEGFFGLQDDFTKDELLLMLDYGVFFEFIPMRDFDGIYSKNVIGLEDVEVGTNYALVISTNAGLWRYIIGDTIRFTSKTPFRFKVTGRTKSFINAFGEEIVVDEALKNCNSDYEAKRSHENALAQVKMNVASPGLFEKWLKSAGKLGGQHKVPRLANDRVLFDEILALNLDA